MFTCCTMSRTNYGFFAPWPFRPWLIRPRTLDDSLLGSFASWLVRPLADSLSDWTIRSPLSNRGVQILKFLSPRQSTDFDQGSAVSPRPQQERK